MLYPQYLGKKTTLDPDLSIIDSCATKSYYEVFNNRNQSSHFKVNSNDVTKPKYYCCATQSGGNVLCQLIFHQCSKLTLCL